MLTRISGQLELISDGAVPAATLTVPGGMAFEVLLPKYLGETLESRIGETIVLHTMVYLESQGQGTSFLPRIVGFGTVDEKAFFEVFTTAKGVGNKKALRAMIEPPSVIAAAIVSKDTKALTKLPEIGKRLAETILAQLSGKVERFAGDAILQSASGAASIIEPSTMSGAASEAVAALMALGEQRNEAERKVSIACTKLGGEPDVDAIVSVIFAGRTG
jgi:Holliday junction DNA helicase RuvA